METSEKYKISSAEKIRIGGECGHQLLDCKRGDVFLQSFSYTLYFVKIKYLQHRQTDEAVKKETENLTLC